MDLLKHLASFVAVAEERHFGRAAERLHLAQSPLSGRIRRLEQELGVTLFVRTSRHVGLTPAGRVLLGEARGLLQDADALRAVMARVRDDGAGAVRAGLSPGLGAQVSARLVRRFRLACPAVRLEVRQSTTAEQAQSLSEGALDVGLLMHPFSGSGLVAGQPLEKPLGVLVRDDSALARRTEVGLEELDGRSLVLFPRATAPEAFDRLLVDCRAHGFDPCDIHQAHEHDIGLGLVMAGEAVALTTRPHGDRTVAWRPLRGRPLRLRASAVWRRDTGGPEVRAFNESAVITLRDDAGWVPDR